MKTTHSSEPAVQSRHPSKKDLRDLEKVRTIFAALSKYIRAKTIYLSNNPIVNNFANAFYETFQAYFENEKELLLTIEQYQIKWRGEVVYDNTSKTDSIAFKLFKDGVGELVFQSSVNAIELEKFVDIIKDEIYNPSSHLDIVGKFWQSEFIDISYRVYDEHSDGASGDGKGSGNESRVKFMQANDHTVIPVGGATEGSNTALSECPTESLGTYLYRFVEKTHPDAASCRKEMHIQNTLESLFMENPEELGTWRDEFYASNDRDKLLWFLDIMFDFASKRSTPSVVRDIFDIVERLISSVMDEANIPTLIKVLTNSRKMAQSGTIAVDFQAMPDRIEETLTNSAFLLSLVKKIHKSRNDVRDILKYFRMIGKNAIPGACELLSSMEDQSLHKLACDTLLSIEGEDVIQIIDYLNLDNPLEARDAVYLLQHVIKDEISPIIKELTLSHDPHIRECVVDYLILAANDEAATLLSLLLEDDDIGVRIKTLAAVEEFKHPMIIEKITDMCFEEEKVNRSTDELERMFRTLGKLGGEGVLEPIKKMIKKKSWFSFGKAQGKQNKTLSITALRYVPGDEAKSLLNDLAGDRDNLVRKKALYVLSQLRESKNEDHSPVEREESKP